MSVFTYDDEYIGPRWTYATVLRPVARFSIPDEGWIVGSNKEHPKYRFGTVDYTHPLTDEELYHYDMILVSESKKEL